MRAVWFVGRAELRQRWGSVVVLTLLVGVVGAVVLASTASARRSATAFERFQDETLSPDLTVFIPEVDDATIAELRAIPGVEAIGVGRQFTATLGGQFVTSTGGPLDDQFGVIPVAALVVLAIGTLVNVVAYIPGRRAARRPPAAVLRSE